VLEELIENKPAEVLARMESAEAQALADAERTTFAQRALEKLIVQVGTDANPGQVLADLRRASQSAKALAPAHREGLSALTRLTEDRIVLQGVGDVRRLAEGGRWPQAGAEVDRLLERLGDNPQARGTLSPEMATRFRQTMARVSDLGFRSTALDALREGLRKDEHLAGLAVGGLPKDLHPMAHLVRGVAATQRLIQAAEKPKPREVKSAVAELEAGLQAVPGTDPTLGKQVLQDLALEAFLDGRPDDFDALWPADGPAAHARLLLGELKAQALGSGAAAPGPAGDGERRGRAAQPAPGLRALVPQTARAAWHPPPAGDRGPTALEQASQAARALAAKAEPALAAAAASLEKERQGSRGDLDALAAHLARRSEGEQRCFAVVQVALGRPLGDQDRARVRYFAALGQADLEIGASLAQGDEAVRAEFLRKVAGARGRELTPEECKRALELRQEGRPPAAVAAVLDAGR
jgi:hypothetical protein